MDEQEWLREIRTGFVGTKKDAEERGKKRKALESELEMRKQSTNPPPVTDTAFANALAGLQTATTLILEMENTELPKELKAEVKNSLEWFSNTYLTRTPSINGRPIPALPPSPGAPAAYYCRQTNLNKQLLLSKLDELDRLERDLCFIARDVYQEVLPDHGESFIRTIQHFSTIAYQKLSKDFHVKECEDEHARALRKQMRDPFVAEMSLAFEEKTFRTPAARALGEKYSHVKMKTRKLLYIDNELAPIQQWIQLLNPESGFAGYKPLYPLEFTAVSSLGDLEFQCYNLLESLERFSKACPGKVHETQNRLAIMSYPETEPSSPPSPYDKNRAELLGAKYFPKCTECGNFSPDLYSHKKCGEIPYCVRLQNMVELARHANNILECLEGWANEEPRGTPWSPPLVTVMRGGKRKQMKLTTYDRLKKEGKL